MIRRTLIAAAVAALIPATAKAADQPVGTVTDAKPLPSNLWIPDTTAQAFRLTYVTTDVHGKQAPSTGELFVPKGKAPAGGWPVISWAHGTSGIGDSCAPSVMGPAEPGRDFPYLSRWMKQGYAIVASDYAGLGTDGIDAYLNGTSEAHNVVDMVKAGRQYASEHLLADEQLSNRWVVIGQSQGGGASIYTARYATQFGGSSLDYLGAVGTGVPAYIEDLISTLGPGVTPAPVSGNLASYAAYILAGMRASYPELQIDSALSDLGKQVVDRAETECVEPFAASLKSTAIGGFFSKPLATLPDWRAKINAYMKMPESGYDKPFFMGHGTLDTDVPFATTSPYVAALMANNQPLTFKAYPTDHSGALLASQADAIPFVAKLFGGAGVGPTPTIKTRLTLVGKAKKTRITIAVVANANTKITLTARKGKKTIAKASKTTAADGTATIKLRIKTAYKRVTIRGGGARLKVKKG